MYAKELYTVRELILLGVKVYFDDKRGGLVFIYGPNPVFLHFEFNHVLVYNSTILKF